jgi:AraC family transcriptional regulator
MRAHHGQTLLSCNLGRASVTEVLYRPWTSVAPHVHPAPHVAFVCAGEMIESGDGVTGRIAADGALVRPAGFRHENSFFGVETRGVIVEMHEIPAPLRPRICSMRAPAFVPSGVPRRLYAKIRRELTSSDAASRVALEGLVLEFLAAVFRALPPPAAAPAEIAAEIRRRIESSPRRRADTDALARHLGLSRVQFVELFRRAQGCSPEQYARAIRLDRARALLRESPLPLAAVAAECGFYDQAHFTRAFKRATGVTPLAYRRRP